MKYQIAKVKTKENILIKDRLLQKTVNKWTY